MESKKRSIDIDMLSGLPDEVLHHILSFLPTKASVRTSVLAKRWRFLWAHVPNLKFYGHDFRGSNTPRLDSINRVIMLHEAKTVNTFKLFRVKGSAHQLETLIIYPIKRGVQNLYLHFGFKVGENIVCNFPRLLLTCKTLVNLQLINCGVIPSSGDLFLPSLKKLNLSYVDYEAEESLPHLLSGCPVLEELIVKDSFREERNHSGCVIVSSPTIKKLDVDFSMLGAQDPPDKMLIIGVPALIYLKVTQCRFEYVDSFMKTLTSLIEAEITLDGWWHACDFDCTEHDHSIDFLSCLCHVRYLKISTDFGDTLADIVGSGSMPKFVHLSKLELNLMVNWFNLVKFLEVADNLEVLIINIWEMPPYKEPKRVPPCMLSCLRTVRLHNFFACQDVFEVVRYILRNAQVLEKMEVYPEDSSSDKEKLDTLRRIALFERGSKSCQLVFNTN